MKKLLAVFLLALLVGCGSENVIEEIDSHIEKVRGHAETAASDLEGYLEDLEEFNKYLLTIDDERFSKYIELQIEANTMRADSLEPRDPDRITESSLLQAQALQILDELKESE